MLAAIVRSVPRLALGVVGALALFAGSSWAASQRIQFRAQMSVEEFERCGLGKLSSAELAALEAWINQRIAVEPRVLGVVGSPPPTTSSRSIQSPSPNDPMVSFNVSSHKYHCPSCRYALSCTKNCIDLRLSEARRRGGVPCGSCGGLCR